MKAVSQAKRFRERRQKLGEFLKGGEAVEDHFDIRSWYAGPGEPRDLARKIRENEVGCGTTACAAGFCPVVFPHSWELRGCIPVLKKRPYWKSGSSLRDFSKFFGVDVDIVGHICDPSERCEFIVYNSMKRR